jgi:threonine dehydratase
MNFDKNIIKNTSERISPYINKTPVITSQILNNLFNTEIFFKAENLQKAGAFKSRGAVNAIFSLTENELKHGVATHSSGNHAQALARAASLRNCKAYIVMPENSPKIKIQAVKFYGGDITFCKPTLADRENTLKVIIDKTKAKEIHPYNNQLIIEGQSTAAFEFYSQVENLDYILTPVGGGGLTSGTALATAFFSPKTKVIAVEPEQANDAYLSFMNNTIIPSVNPNTIADGLRTSLGDLTFPIIKKYVSQIVTVSEEAIIKSMKLFWETAKLIIEPSSAVCIAALFENKFDFRNKRIGIILSGGNVDLDKLPWQ